MDYEEERQKIQEFLKGQSKGCTYQEIALGINRHRSVVAVVLDAYPDDFIEEKHSLYRLKSPENETQVPPSPPPLQETDCTGDVAYCLVVIRAELAQAEREFAQYGYTKTFKEHFAKIHEMSMPFWRTSSPIATPSEDDDDEYF